ncbi:MAG: hypothetical protein CO113_14185 [Elusimicrobia bacterium CG_4_9_14_3_um_filter_62_55]|nr:MAG: hypothetical protein COR54_19530 [Elusimicrobia bacterium CG22_combo_CG10-13_8_21_14_all_63_91]PJB24393.1 MAG: hypothetical protein CO113_14185 [Elusimicrobia bacterium CG_4_9_14_3_um_filter_62_55]
MSSYHSANTSLVRVAFFEPYPMGLGGNFLTQHLILERLDPKRFKPLIIAPADGAALTQFRAMGVECVVLKPSGVLGSYGGAALRTNIFCKIKSVFDLVRYNLQIARLLRKYSIDVIYSNCVRAQLCVGLGALLTRTPSLLYIKGELANPIIDRLCYFLASKLLFFCESNRDDQYPILTRWYARKIDILRIGMDTSQLEAVENADHTEIRRGLSIRDDALNAVVIAQLYKPKGQHLAIEALAKLVLEFPNLHLYLLGDHVIDEYRPYRDELETQIARHRLEKHVHFTGWRKDALAITTQMDIVIHPSLSEGFGRAVLEAMALGKPVIASAVGGLREAIKDGQNGYLVATGDAKAIENRWRELAKNPSLRKKLGTEAKRTVYRDYLIDDKVERLSSIWRSMVGKDGR